MIPAAYTHKRDPELIARVIEMKRHTRYYAGEGFQVVISRRSPVGAAR